MKRILILSLIVTTFIACSKEDTGKCVCKNWAKGGKIEAEYGGMTRDQCNQYQVQYDKVWPGEVVCSLE